MAFLARSATKRTKLTQDNEDLTSMNMDELDKVRMQCKNKETKVRENGVKQEQEATQYFEYATMNASRAKADKISKFIQFCGDLAEMNDEEWAFCSKSMISARARGRSNKMLIETSSRKRLAEKMIKAIEEKEDNVYTDLDGNVIESPSFANQQGQGGRGDTPRGYDEEKEDM